MVLARPAIHSLSTHISAGRARSAQSSSLKSIGPPSTAPTDLSPPYASQKIRLLSSRWMGLKAWYVYKPPVSPFDDCPEAIASCTGKCAAWRRKETPPTFSSLRRWYKSRATFAAKSSRPARSCPRSEAINLRRRGQSPIPCDKTVIAYPALRMSAHNSRAYTCFISLVTHKYSVTSANARSAGSCSSTNDHWTGNGLHDALDGLTPVDRDVLVIPK
jgi:hypothetical protein